MTDKDKIDNTLRELDDCEANREEYNEHEKGEKDQKQ